MDEKISLGMERIKRRSKTVDKTSEQVLEISQPGLWVELATYQQNIAKDPSTNGHETYTIDDPATAKPMQAVWVPKHNFPTSEDPSAMEGFVPNPLRLGS